jgi:hypothetical protein
VVNAAHLHSCRTYRLRDSDLVFFCFKVQAIIGEGGRTRAKGGVCASNPDPKPRALHETTDERRKCQIPYGHEQWFAGAEVASHHVL